MTHAVVIGGSISGCAAALALSDLGYDVTVLEKDPGPLPADPDEAHHGWDRPGVPQGLQSHAFTSRGVNLLADRAPDIYAALIDAGAKALRLGGSMPRPSGADTDAGTDAVTDAGAEKLRDDELTVLACRRRTFELVLRRETARRPGITLRTGVAVQGLVLTDGSGDAPRRVTGVRTGTGAPLPAGLVIDATGRRSLSGTWLAKEGVPQPEDVVHRSRMTAYARFYRLRTDEFPGPLNRDNAAGAVWDGYAAFLHPGDNNTFSITYGVLPDDEALRALREDSVFHAAAAANPFFQPWLEPGVAEPISGVRVMPSPDNVLRGAAVDPGQQPVHGLFRVGDAACVTNPLYGRGVALGLSHAYALADVLGRYPEVGEEQSREAAVAAEAHFRPWFAQSVRTDAERLALWNRAVHGITPPETEPGGLTLAQVSAAATRDPVVWRHLARLQMSLPPTESSLTPADLRLRVLRACEELGPLRPLGPYRAQLLATIAETMEDTVPDSPLRLVYPGSPDAVEKILASAEEAGHRHPVTVSEALISDPYGKLRAGEADVMITRFRVDEPDLTTGPVLYTEERIVAVAADHPLASRASVTSDDLADYDMFQRPGAFPPDVYDQLVPRVSAQGRPLHRRCTADSIPDMFAAIAEGRAVHPTIASMRAVSHPGVVYVPITDLDPAPVCLVWVTERASSTVLAFARAAAEGFAASATGAQR
ncbi:LysR substrate-binding domain-containing protein [Streptomyces sp. NPDC001700]